MAECRAKKNICEWINYKIDCFAAVKMNSLFLNNTFAALKCENKYFACPIDKYL